MRQDVHFFFIVGGMGARIRSCFDSYKNKSGWHRCSGKFCNGEIDKTHMHTHTHKKKNAMVKTRQRATLTPEWAHMYPEKRSKKCFTVLKIHTE